MRRPGVATLCLLALSAAGCAGPAARVDYGGKAVPINVAFGKPKAPLMVAGPPAVLQPGPGGIGVVPAGPPAAAVRAPSVPSTTPARQERPPQPVTAAPDACPRQDPLAVPRNEATNLVDGPVPEGSFPYRISGSFTVNGKKTPYEAVLVQQVQRLPQDAAGRRRFATSFTLLGLRYTVTYAITVPVEGPAQTVPGEIALASVVQDSSDGSGASFRPAEPLRLLQLRAERGVSWTEASNDPLSATSATVAGQIVDKNRVNACGQPVEAWKASVTQRTISAGQDITATRTLSFATGLGGLLVAEQVSYAGTAGGDKVSGESTMTINVDPGAP